MPVQLFKFILLSRKLFSTIIIIILFALQTTAQKKIKPEKPFKPTAKEFVISYTISVKGVKADGIAETYNGGLKTAFVKNDMVRLRLVSLMRTQSIFYDNKKATSKKVATVVKESGKERASMVLNAKQWKVFNSKTDSSRCEIFKDDTIRILNFLCAKAIITTKDSSKLEVYFLPSAKNKILNAAEPLFAKIPGLVMQYSYTKADKTITYTATTLKSAPIVASTFTIPLKGYLQVKYNPGGATTATGDLDADDNEEGTEEEEMETTITPPATKETPKPPSTL
jgi:hypothetical protein